ncbi:MAG: hypothetical protein HFH71_01190 [Clostridia bacterium]|nr:hypothetical protein [Clostridia bacterium]
MYDIITALIKNPFMSLIILAVLVFNRRRIISAALSAADKVTDVCSAVMLLLFVLVKIAAVCVVMALPHISAFVVEKIFAAIVVTCVWMLIDIVSALPAILIAMFGCAHFNASPLYTVSYSSLSDFSGDRSLARKVFRLLN